MSGRASADRHLNNEAVLASMGSEETRPMKVLVFVKATADSEASVMPSTELLVAMGQYNQELIDAGIMQGGDGLKASRFGKRVKFDGASRLVTDGPFAETNEVVAGFWIWEVKDMDEAIAWVKKCPNPMPGPSEIEIRPVITMEDFAEIMTPEAEAIHQKNTDTLAAQQS